MKKWLIAGLFAVGILTLINFDKFTPRYDGAFSQKHISKIKQARLLWADRRSREIFDASVRLYDHSDFKPDNALASTAKLVAYGLFKPPVSSGSALYFHPSVSIARDAVIIDAGALGGTISMPMLDFSKKASRGKVLAFDPDPTDMAFWVDRMHLWTPDNIEFYPLALWSKTQSMHLNILPRGGASLVVEDIYAKQIPVQTISIDDFVKERNLDKLDFIKIDTQGSELHILAGARQTLRRFKPDIAVSAFYNTEDLFTLILYLDSLDLDYKFRLESHNSNSFYTGRVLYAN